MTLGYLALWAACCASLTAQVTDTWDRAKPVVEAWGQRDRAEGGSASGRRQLETEIMTWLDERPGEVWAYDAAALGLNRVDRNARAVEVVRRYLRRFPKDRALAARVWFFFGNWGSLEDLKLVPIGWQDDREYWQTAYHLAARAKKGPELAKAYRELLVRTPPSEDPAGRERHYWAEDLLQLDLLVEAEQAARQAVAIAEVAPPPVPGTLMAFHRATLGWVLHRRGQDKEALREMEQAIRTGAEARNQDRDMYLRYALMLERSGRKEEALAALEKEAAWGSDAVARREWTRVAGNAPDDDALARINDLALSRLDLEKDGFREFDEALTVNDLTDFEGRPLDLLQWRGRPVVIEFWATWCTPCRTAMAQTHALVREVPMTVVAVSIDAVERTELVKRFIADHKYEVVLARGGLRLQGRFGRAVPARYLMDASGRLRAVEQGYSGATAAAFARKVRSLKPPV